MGPNPLNTVGYNPRLVDLLTHNLVKKVQVKNCHHPDTCPKCGLKSYGRMSDKEKRVHRGKHERVANRRAA